MKYISFTYLLVSSVFAVLVCLSIGKVREREGWSTVKIVSASMVAGLLWPTVIIFALTRKRTRS